jgi:hypothetical protein
LESYQAFFDGKTPRDYEVASFIKSHTTDTDSVFLWGDSAQIYSLSGKIPPGRYTVAYHIRQNDASIAEMQKVLDDTQPKYIIVLSEAPPLPFRLPMYASTFSFTGATIYERYEVR